MKNLKAILVATIVVGFLLFGLPYIMYKIETSGHAGEIIEWMGIVVFVLFMIALWLVVGKWIHGHFR